MPIPVKNNAYQTVSAVIGSALVDNGTTTFSYPTGYNESMFAKSGHKLSVLNGGDYNDESEIAVAFGLSTITLTNQTETTIPAGSTLFLQCQLRGGDTQDPAVMFGGRVRNMQAAIINLGAPTTAVANGFVASQDLTALGVFSVNGTAAAAIAAASLVGVNDVPRNIVAAWTGTAVLTVTGTDVLGNVVKESSASGTSFTGAKAFKTVTSVSVSANVTALTVGNGVVLGLPFFLPSTGYILKELIDDGTAVAGTTVAGVQTEPTATTGDVRGTYNPNSAPNSDRNFSLIVAVESFSVGADNFAG